MVMKEMVMKPREPKALMIEYGPAASHTCPQKSGEIKDAVGICS
jgi:hypothetical protein